MTMRPDRWSLRAEPIRVGRTRTFVDAARAWEVATQEGCHSSVRWAGADAFHALLHVAKLPNLGRKHPLKCLRKVTGRKNHPAGLSRLAYAAVVLAIGAALPCHRPRVVYDAIRFAARTTADLRVLLQKAAEHAYALAHGRHPETANHHGPGRVLDHMHEPGP